MRARCVNGKEQTIITKVGSSRSSSMPTPPFTDTYGYQSFFPMIVCSETSKERMP